jgi:cation transport ATPase
MPAATLTFLRTRVTALGLVVVVCHLEALQSRRFSPQSERSNSVGRVKRRATGWATVAYTLVVLLVLAIAFWATGFPRVVAVPALVATAALTLTLSIAGDRLFRRHRGWATAVATRPKTVLLAISGVPCAVFIAFFWDNLQAVVFIVFVCAAIPLAGYTQIRREQRRRARAKRR